MTASSPEVGSVDRSGRIYLIALILLVVVLSLVSATATPTPGTREYVAGQFFGQLIAPALLTAVVYAVVRVATRKKPRSSSIKITFWIVLVWSFLLFANFIANAGRAGAMRGSAVITKDQREALRVSPDSIKNDSLGFALPHPGTGFIRSTQVEQMVDRQLKNRRDMATWAFVDTAQGKSLAIQATTFPNLNEDAFRQLAGLMRKAARGASVFTETVTWTADRHEYVIGVHLPNGVMTITRCLPRLKKGAELFVCAQMAGPDTVGLSRIPNALTVVDD